MFFLFFLLLGEIIYEDGVLFFGVPKPLICSNVTKYLLQTDTSHTTDPTVESDGILSRQDCVTIQEHDI